MKKKFLSRLADITKVHQRAAFADVEEQIGNLMKAITDGLYTPTMKPKMLELEARKEQLAERIREIELRQAVATASKRDVLNYISSFGDIRQADSDDQRKAIEIFIDKIIINGDGADIYIMSPTTNNKISHENVTGLPAPASCENPLLIHRMIKKAPR